MNWLTLEGIAGQLWAHMADSSLRAIVLAALAGVLIACLRKRAAAQHVVWTVVVVGMMFLPVLRPMVPAAHLPISQPSVLGSVSDAPEPQLAPINDVAAPAGAANPPSRAAVVGLSWRTYVVMVYLTGLLLFAIRLSLGFLMTRSLLRRARPIREDLWRHHNLIADTGVDVDIQESQRVLVPVTLGLRTMRVILPTGWRAWPEEKITVVLAHELAHVRRRDPLLAFLAALNKCVFWFHPLAWWLERRLAVLAEQAADDAGVAAASDAESYARLVLEVATGMKEQNRRLVWHGAAMDGPLLAQRIRRIIDPRTQKYVKRIGKPARVGLLTSAGLLLWITAAVDFHSVARAQTADPSQFRGSVAFTMAKEAKNPNCLCFLTDDKFPDPKPVTTDEVATMERQLASNPEDEPTRSTLLRYYWKNNLEGQRIPLVLWLIDHHPESPLHQYETAGIFLSYPHGHPGTATIVDDAKQRWQAQVERHPEDAQVLLNAARFLNEGSLPEAIDLLKRAQKLDPAKKTSALAWVYSGLLVRSAYTGKARSSASDFRKAVLVPQIRSDLQSSSDITLVGAVAHHVVNDSLQQSKYESLDIAALKAIATELVTHAQALQPQNQEWSDLMEEAKGLSEAPQQHASLGNGISSVTSPTLVRVGEQVAAGNLIQAPPPVYPPLAETAHIEGVVALLVRIGTDGHVSDPKVLSGHPMLVQAALDAVKNYAYKPFLLNGQAVACQATVEVPFKLDSAGTVDETGLKSHSAAPASGTALPVASPQVRVSKGVMAGNLIESPKPVYPALARAAQVRGVVVLNVHIGSDGHVTEATVVSGHPMLTQAAIDAVKQYVYKPYTLNGNPIEVVTLVEVPFAGDQT
jgi:TonB family protein